MNERIEKLCRKIKGYTQSNNHNEAVLILALFLDDKYSITEMQGTQHKQDRIGSMTAQMLREVDDIRRDLLNTLLFQYGEDNWKKVKASF